MKLRKFISSLAGVSALAVATPAMADWKTVETENFVYYSEGKTEDIKQNAVRLEMFDRLVRALTNNQREGTASKLRIFELKDIDTLQRLSGAYGAGGYYTNNDMGPYVVVFREDVRSSGTMFKTNQNSVRWGPEVRQHEYLHHYMYQFFNANYPSWYSEGFAEYYGTMAFPEENVVEIGHAPYGRMNAIKRGGWLPAEELLTARSYGEVSNLGALYAQGWLLTHMAARNPERGKQLADYLNRLVAGEDYGDAARAAFGDLDKLDKELKQHSKDIQAVRLSLKPMDVGAVEVTEMSEFESDMFNYIMRVNVGIRDNDIGRIRSHVREVRQANPTNLLGLEAQARLALRAEDYDDVLTQAEAFLAQDPNSAMGKMFKGVALVMKVDKNAPANAYDEGRDLLAQAANADPSNPEPLIYFYRSYLLGDGIPPADAQNALMRAHQLLPGHRQLRMYAARDFEWRGMIDEAIFMVNPLAFGSFDGDERAQRRRDEAIAEAVEKYGRMVVEDTPKEMLDRLVAKRDGTWNDETQTIASK